MLIAEQVMKPTVFILFLSFTVLVYPQTGGDNTYEFLNMSTFSTASSLGGYTVSLESENPSYAFYNPALLGPQNNGSIAINYSNYLAGINYGSAIYSLSFEKYGSFAGGIHYLNYGKFDRADPSGNITGTFRASEYALNLIWSYRIDSVFNAGINVKPVFSFLESYSSIGIAMDIGARYKSKDGLYSAGLVIRNIGIQLSTYYGNRDNLPFEIIAGGSARLAHAPFRFSVTARHLQKYRLIHEYLDPEENGLKTYDGFSEVAENLFRHLSFGVEFIPSNNFYIAAGFNYKQRKELALDARASTVGFSLGAGLKLSSFELGLSRSKYHLSGSHTNLSLLLKPGLLLRRN